VIGKTSVFCGLGDNKVVLRLRLENERQEILDQFSTAKNRDTLRQSKA